MSFFFWVLIIGQKDISVYKEVVLEYRVSAGFELREPTKQIKILISGKRSSLRNIDSKKVRMVFDLRGLSLGPKKIPSSLGSINLPVGVKVLSYEPRLVSVYMMSK